MAAVITAIRNKEHKRGKGGGAGGDGGEAGDDCDEYWKDTVSPASLVFVITCTV